MNRNNIFWQRFTIAFKCAFWTGVCSGAIGAVIAILKQKEKIPSEFLERSMHFQCYYSLLILCLLTFASQEVDNLYNIVSFQAVKNMVELTAHWIFSVGRMLVYFTDYRSVVGQRGAQLKENSFFEPKSGKDTAHSKCFVCFCNRYHVHELSSQNTGLIRCAIFLRQKEGWKTSRHEQGHRCIAASYSILRNETETTTNTRYGSPVQRD